MRRVIIATLVGALAVPGVMATGAGAAPGTVRVTSALDDGPGSLREALTSGAERIIVDPSVDTIVLNSSLDRSGATPLRLQGNGVTIDASGVEHGLHVIIPANQVGLLDVELRDLTVTGSALHGVYIDDNLGSPASVALTTNNVTLEGNGIGESDQDGVRVDERAVGSITFTSRASTFSNTGADGVELDETGAGDVVLDVQGSSFVNNGPTDPADLDDGIDVDETDAGSLRGSIRSSSFVHNYDEGIDLNESGDGSIEVSLVNVLADQTVDGDGIAFEELDAGNLDASVVASTVTNNGDDGIQAEQFEPGNGVLELRSTRFAGNADDDVNLDGVELV
jgi:hypothetical protein